MADYRFCSSWAKRNGPGLAIARLVGPMKSAGLRPEAGFRFAIIEDFTPRPGHIDAAAELVQPFGDGTYPMRFHPRFGRLGECPNVKERRLGVEQDRADELW
jgi:hypothetical protein